MLLQTSDVKIKRLSEKDTTAVFEFSPLPSGFGRTMGNSLRRILLSSLKGAAVTRIRIPKVTHQFSTLPGVKEDVVEITLNLKNVVAKSHSNNPVIGTISKAGPGNITAGDIKISSEVEIINKDLHLATLADKNSKFEAEITFEPGVGYSPVEERKTSKIGEILVDAIFSPVVSVSYEVSATRKGEEVGLDKLLLTVKTDGSLSPSEAVVEAATTLRNFFSRFAKGEDPEELKPEDQIAELSEGVKSNETFIDDLSLPTRTVNALKKHGIDTLSQLSSLSDEELADIKNLGEKSVKEIKKLLKKEGLN